MMHSSVIFNNHTAIDLHSFSKVVIISDATVFNLYQKKLTSLIDRPYLPIILEKKEAGKTIQSAEYCWKKMIEEKCDRKSVIIALGGGSITDIAGFVASTYMRGISLFLYPTTLLAMVDASIGGKTAFNFGGIKNSIGSFYPAERVYIDIEVLQSLDTRIYHSGIAEVIKYGVINPLFFQWIEQNRQSILQRETKSTLKMIQKSIEIKQTIIKQDPKDQGIRAYLNFGHTFGHAIEALTNYQTYYHGEAVSIGMAIACFISLNLLKSPCEEFRKLLNLIEDFSLPTTTSLSADLILQKMEQDKKAHHQKISCILVEKFGSLIIYDTVCKTLFKELIEEFCFCTNTRALVNNS